MRGGRAEASPGPRARGAARLAAHLALAKPRITGMAMLVAAGACWLAAAETGAGLPAGRALLAVLAIGALVAGAGALNMVVERRTDKLMERTKDRPLPSGRLAPAEALANGGLFSVLGLSGLLAVAGPVPAGLGGLALVNYVLLYTPLKRVTPWALLPGAASGAAPVLLGWTAATSRLDAGGLALFAILFIWQVPHFLAITLYRWPEYARAGLKVFPAVHGEATARAWLVASTALLGGATLALVPIGLAGGVFAGLGGAASLALLAGAVAIAWRPGAAAWPRRYYLGTVFFLPFVVAALALDRVLA